MVKEETDFAKLKQLIESAIKKEDKKAEKELIKKLGVKFKLMETKIRKEK